MGRLITQFDGIAASLGDPRCEPAGGHFAHDAVFEVEIRRLGVDRTCRHRRHDQR